MHSTYALYNIVPTAFFILLIATFIDVFIDKYRKVGKINKKRIILYSFIFYFICLVQIKIGGMTLAQNPADQSRNFISTNDWFGVFDTLYFKISIWSYSAFVYNVIIFVPLGILLILLIGLKKYNITISIVVLSCFLINVIHLLFEMNGFTMRTISNLNLIYLFFNILGGTLGVFIVKYVKKFFYSYKLNNQLTSSDNH